MADHYAAGSPDEPIWWGDWTSEVPPPTVEELEALVSPPKRPMNLPDTFWTARPALEHIRQAAHASGRSADAVLGCVLARLASMVSHDLVFDFGQGPGSLNLMVAVVGPSGVGKSAAHALASRLLPVPQHLAGDLYRDGIGLGSGEGLAEAYYGIAMAETGELKADGTPKIGKVRMQVRNNASFYVDEGETLTKTIERAGATIGPAIRTAWVGATLGQANAREETTRVLPARSYALGLVVGYQRRTAQPLLADVGPGTPQRFLWLSATDPTVPDVQPTYPGPLSTDCLVDGFRPLRGTITCHESISAELWQRNLARVRGEAEDAELDSHEPLALAKLACLLAVLDGGRMWIDPDDWALARVLWDTSTGVRDSLLDYGREVAAEEAEARNAAYAAREERAQLARTTVDARLDQVARWIGRRVHDRDTTTRGDVRRAMKGNDRSMFDHALARAIAEGWVRTDGDRVLLPGESRPA